MLEHERQERATDGGRGPGHARHGTGGGRVHRGRAQLDRADRQRDREQDEHTDEGGDGPRGDERDDGDPDRCGERPGAHGPAEGPPRDVALGVRELEQGKRQGGHEQGDGHEVRGQQDDEGGRDDRHPEADHRLDDTPGEHREAEAEHERPVHQG